MRPTKLLTCALLLALGTSCKASKASHAIHVPGEDASIEDYEDMLVQTEAALSDIGIEPGARAGAGDDADGAALAAASAETKVDTSGFNGDCKTLCDLSSTTCELEARICVLAARHDGDERYENACSRAGNDCAVAEGIADTSCECEY